MSLLDSLLTPSLSLSLSAGAQRKTQSDIKQSEIRKALANIFAEAMLESDMPEHRKIGVRVLMKAKSISEQMSEIMDVYADPDKDGKDENKEKANYPVRQEINDFLERLEVEISEFINSHPLPTDTCGTE